MTTTPEPVTASVRLDDLIDDFHGGHVDDALPGLHDGGVGAHGAVLEHETELLALAGGDLPPLSWYDGERW